MSSDDHSTPLPMQFPFCQLFPSTHVKSSEGILDVPWLQVQGLFHQKVIK